MSFKAKLATPQIITAKDGKSRQSVSEIEYKFTKNKIHLPTNSINFLVKIIIQNKSDYKLVVLEKDDLAYSKDSKYQAVLPNVTVNLVTTPFQTWMLRFTHGTTLIQKEKREIIKTFVALAIAIITYFLGEFYGFNAGYQKGLEEAKLSLQDTTQSIMPNIPSKNQLFDTSRNPYKTDTTNIDSK